MSNSFFVLGGVAIGLSIICAPFVAPALRKYCLPYVPATTQQVENIMSVLGKPVVGNVSPRLLDIGSGDGRIVIGKCLFLISHRNPSQSHNSEFFKMLFRQCSSRNLIYLLTYRECLKLIWILLFYLPSLDS